MAIKVYYHENCFDGMASAYVAWTKFRDDAQYLPINYGQTNKFIGLEQDCYENAIINDDIYFIDFSLPRALMDMIYNKANKLVVLDHHKTAEANLKDAAYAIFDLNESGASLAWKYFYPNGNLPLLIRYIKDRDLWLFKEEFSREINAYIQSYEMSIKNYSELDDEFQLANMKSIIDKGTALRRYQDKLVKDMCKNAVTQNIGGYNVPVTNASVLFSEVGNALCIDDEYKSNRSLFAAYYFDRADGKRQWGLRSIGNFDVSEVAKQYGSGGHKNAAGFITDVNQTT